MKNIIDYIRYDRLVCVNIIDALSNHPIKHFNIDFDINDNDYFALHHKNFSIIIKELETLINE